MSLVRNCIGNDGAVRRNFDDRTVDACAGNISKHSFYPALRKSDACNNANNILKNKRIAKFSF